ncbi:MAG: hypothetical protein HC871_13000 [Rhizobiales bacterium]|nr:hypothetical protein [Hyphomicrobiales bacterium]
MLQKVLIVVHQDHSSPGKIGDFLSERGYALDRRCPNLGDPLPADMSAYAAAVIFGGPMSANDDHLDGIRAELDWLERRVTARDCPLLGICSAPRRSRACSAPGSGRIRTAWSRSAMPRSARQAPAQAF